MKRDWDIIRDILLKTEELEPNKKLNAQDFDDDIDIIGYHVELLNNASLIRASFLGDDAGGIAAFAILKLTWEGHDFLDSIRNDDIWNKTKSKMIEKGGTMTFDIVKAVAINFIKSSLNL